MGRLLRASSGRVGVVAVCLLVLVLAEISLPLSAHANDTTSCLHNVTGASVRWDASWQSDRLDNDVSYLVVDAVRFSTASSATVTLELTANGPAKKHQRYLVVDANTFRKKVCGRITQANTRVQKHSSARKGKTKAPTQRLQFIRYTTRGWVKADPPQQKTLAKCSILGRSYLCLEEEKQRFGEQLKTVEAEIKAQPRLYH